MSDKKKPVLESDLAEDEPQKGFNLTLAYSLLGLAMVVAICVALFIVLPFYHRR
jgi:hypothetical protein